MQNNPNTNSNSKINIDDLVKQIYTLYPHLSSDNKEADEALRKKLHLQFIVAVPQVKLKHQNLKCIIMNVKKSLCEFQKRIDESVAQQQLRRTTRIRRTIHQDPQVINFFNHGHKYEKTSASPTCNTKCCHQVSDLGELVQVESLPVSASTNLLTIFVPSILQEQLHSCKYKISIDLNRMDLTKKIIDLNLEHQANSSLETKEETLKAIDSIDENKDDQECKLTYEITGNTVTNNNVLETQITNSTENNPKIELKFSPNTENLSPSLEPTVSIETDTAVPKKKRGAKRKDPKPPSNDPPKKRGRKLGSKNKKKNEKSEIAKYVEMFACNAASTSNVSQLVSSTTQNWDALPDQGGQIAYFMNGEWTTLSAPINACSQLVSTNNETAMNFQETVGGSETYIPFEDFVNYIDNPSIDVGNNVIARVLAGSVDAPPDNANPLISMCAGTLQTVTIDENMNAIQNKPSTSKAMDIDIVHSATVTKKPNASGGAMDLSKDFDISFNVNVLDLTQKQVKNTTSTFEKEMHPCDRDNDNAVDKTVVFSTNRSMPLLDDTEGDIFTSTTVERSESLDKRVVFSIAPIASPVSSNKGSPDGNSVTDSAIEIDRRDTADSSLNPPTSPKDKTNAESIKGMSLLEIEKDIDDSLLDFDTCLDDDLLSLAPSSCFNSPNEERFSESHFMDIDEDKCSTFTNTASSTAVVAPRSQLEAQLNSKLNEDDLNPVLKSFKIPRVKQIADEPSRDLPATKIPTSTQHDISKTENPTVCPSGGKKPPFTTNTPSTNTTESITAKSAFPQVVSTREISKIFGSPCFGFLADNCFEGACKLRHQLLDLNVMITSLSLLRNEVLHCAYRFIWRHHKLFKFYFPIFCEEYARRNLRRKLANMINDCQIQPACLLFLRKIHSALICSGLNKINACRFILNRVKKDRSQMVMDILLEIIIDSDASMFTSVIEQFAQTSGYKFRMSDINQLATTCLRSGSAELITVLIKCLICVDQAEFATRRSPELIQLLEMIKAGGIDGL